jgi:hypothetical protein
MKTEKEVEDVLDAYQNHLDWVSNVIQDKWDDLQMSERSAGRYVRALINKVCDFNVRRPLTIIDLKLWIEE